MAEPQLPNLLFKDHDEFVTQVFAKRQKEIVELHEVKPGSIEDTFKQYQMEV